MRVPDGISVNVIAALSARGLASHCTRDASKRLSCDQRAALGCLGTVPGPSAIVGLGFRVFRQARTHRGHELGHFRLWDVVVHVVPPGAVLLGHRHLRAPQPGRQACTAWTEPRHQAADPTSSKCGVMPCLIAVSSELRTNAQSQKCAYARPRPKWNADFVACCWKA